jgi:hypothetical protein
MTQRPKKVTISTEHVVPIANDAAVAGQVADGRNIPLVILDTTNRPDIEEMIRVHAHVGEGEVRSQWGLGDHRPDDVLLLLEFERPVETRIVLRFSMEERGGLVDMALTSRALYLRAGRPGDRVMHDLEHPRILVDLPDTGFRAVWEDAFLRQLTSFYARETGLPRRKARELARQFLVKWRRLGSFRMPQR